MSEQVITPWHGDWRLRLESKLESLGYGSLEQFLAHNPGVGYVKLAESLGDANIAAMQLYGEQIRSAATRGDLRLAAKDCLVRFVNEYVKRGWGIGQHFPHRLASAYAAWSTTIKTHALNADQIEGYLKEVFDRLDAANPPHGWLPKDADDEIVQKCFEEGWPMN